MQPSHCVVELVLQLKKKTALRCIIVRVIVQEERRRLQLFISRRHTRSLVCLEVLT